MLKPSWQTGLWALIGVIGLLALCGKMPFITALLLALLLSSLALTLGRLGRPLRTTEKQAAGVMAVCVVVAGASLAFTGTWKVVFGGSTNTTAKTRPTVPAGRYDIAALEDVSIKAIGGSLSRASVAEVRHAPTNVRKRVRIVVEPGLSQAQYAATIEQAIRDLTEKHRDIDEIVLFVYDDAGDVDGAYTVARAVWASHGGADTPTIDWAPRHGR